MGAPLMPRSSHGSVGLTSTRPSAALALKVCVLILVLSMFMPSAAAEDDPTPTDLARALLSGLRSVHTSLAVAAGRESQDRATWDWPLVGRPPIVHRFDAPAQRWLPGHRGIDLGGLTGEPVRAVADGVVAYSGVIAGVGVVSVQHPDGLRSTYQPVQDRVGRGEQVRSGQMLGTLDGAGHCGLRTCLHLGAKRGDAYLDPLLLLQAWEVSLLPRD